MINTNTGFQINYGGYGTGASVPIIANTNTMGLQENINLALPASLVASPTAWGRSTNCVMTGNGSNYGAGGDFLCDMSSTFANISGTLPQFKQHQLGLQFWGTGTVTTAWAQFHHLQLGYGACGFHVGTLLLHDSYMDDEGTGNQISSLIQYHCMNIIPASVLAFDCINNTNASARLLWYGPFDLSNSTSVKIPASFRLRTLTTPQWDLQETIRTWRVSNHTYCAGFGSASEAPSARGRHRVWRINQVTGSPT